MAKLDNKTFSATELTKRISEDPSVKVAQQRLDRAITKRNEAQAEVDRLSEQATAIRKRGQAATAELLLYSDEDEFEPGAEIFAQLNEARNRHEIWERAAVLGQKEVETARMAIADQLYREARPEHIGIIKRQLELLAALAEVVAEEAALIHRFVSIGYLPSSEMFSLCSSLRYALQSNSSLAAYVQGLIDRKILEPGDLPGAMRKSWGVS